MKKINRLKKTWEFQKIIKGKKRVFNETFIIFYLPFSGNEKENAPNYRFGISIPQRIVKSSVKRNRCKRQVKGIIDQEKKTINENKELIKKNLVIIIKEKFLINSFAENKKDLILLIEKIRRNRNDKRA